MARIRRIFIANRGEIAVRIIRTARALGIETVLGVSRADRESLGAALATRVMTAVPETTYRAVLAAIVAFDRRAALPAITVPTLCLAGEHDRTAPPKVLRGMADRIPGARYAELAGAGHIANVETPAAFDAAVTAFLNQVLP